MAYNPAINPATPGLPPYVISSDPIDPLVPPAWNPVITNNVPGGSYSRPFNANNTKDPANSANGSHAAWVANLSRYDDLGPANARNPANPAYWSHGVYLPGTAIKTPTL